MRILCGLMRARMRLLAGLSILLTIGVLAPALARAATTEDLVALATGTYGMSCTAS